MCKERKGKVIAVTINKGGMGKTTTTLVLAELMSYLGYRVLVVDMDAQNNSSLNLHAYIEDSESVLAGRELPETPNLYELFTNRLKTKEEVRSTIKRTNMPLVEIIPSSKRCNNILEGLKDCYRSPFILKKALNAIKDDYDYILIDNAPSMDFFILNSIVASDYVLVPLGVDEFSRKGLRETLDVLHNLRSEYDLDTKFLGAFLTLVDRKTNAFKKRYEEYTRELGDKFIRTSVRRDTKINEMNTKQMPLAAVSDQSNALIDYCALLLETDIIDAEAKEILRKNIA